MNYLQQNVDEMCEYIKSKSLKFLTIDGLYQAICKNQRNKLYPQFTDHYFTGDYPIKPLDQIKNNKVTQLSLLSGKSTN